MLGKTPASKSTTAWKQPSTLSATASPTPTATPYLTVFPAQGTSPLCESRGGNPEGQGEGGISTSSPSADARRGIRPDTPDRPTVNSELKTENSPVTHLNILNYEIAHLIRHETAEGHTVVNFLIHTMTGRDRPFTPKKFRIKPADRMAAARELLRRGFGELGSRRKLSDTTDEANAYDTLHTDLARRMREYSERGTDTIRFLLEVMSDPTLKKSSPSTTYVRSAGTSASWLGHQLRQHQA